MRQRTLITAAISIGIWACGPTASDPEPTFPEISALSFDEFAARIYREPESGLYIVNGDELISDEAELRAFYDELVAARGLTVHRSGGADAVWSASQKLNLTYCVSTSFGGNYNAVVTAMTNAANAWEGAANLDFRHLSGEDSSCTASNNNVVFDVRPTSGQPYTARAFFPDDPRSARNILIDSSAFGSIAPYTLTGVLRHELGHTLGFRHEHTRPEAGTCYEDSSWRAVTLYDSSSVMHYPQCNGANSGDLVLTTWDIRGVQTIYDPNTPFSLQHESATGGSVVSTTGTYTQVLYNPGGGLATGTYIAKRYDVRKTVSLGTMQSPSIWCRPETVGWSGANPNWQTGWCTVTSQGATTAELRTFVYELWTILGQRIGYRPASPGSAVFQYTISGELCTPASCGANDCGTIPDGCGGTIYCGSCCTPHGCYAWQCGYASDGCGGTNYCGPCDCTPYAISSDEANPDRPPIPCEY